MSELITLVVGEKYPLKKNEFEGATANFLVQGGSYLQILVAGMSKKDERILRKGKVKAGFVYERGALLLLFQFLDDKAPYMTFDAPFDMRIIPTEYWDLHSIDNELQRLAFEIHIIDDTGILRGLRYITMSPEMTLEFLSAVQDQVTELSKGESVLSKWLNSSPADLLKTTKAWVLGQ